MLTASRDGIGVVGNASCGVLHHSTASDSSMGTVHVTHIKNLKRHPYEFYQKLGYVIVVLVPDANGLGKPDILMAKSIVR